jgi:hypothetical protein
MRREVGKWARVEILWVEELSSVQAWRLWVEGERERGDAILRAGEMGEGRGGVVAWLGGGSVNVSADGANRKQDRAREQSRSST